MVVATGCNESSRRYVLVAPSGSSALDGCRLVRRVRVLDGAGGQIAEARGAERVFGSSDDTAIEPMIDGAAGVDPGSLTVVVEEIGACDQVAARASVAIGARSVARFEWEAGARCPGDPIPFDADTTTVTSFLSCPPSFCVFEATRTGCNLELETRTQGRSCAVGQELTLRVSAEGELLTTGPCTNARVSAGAGGLPRVELDGCGGSSCAATLEAPPAIGALELESVIDAGALAGCPGAGLRGALPLPDGVAMTVAESDDCSRFGVLEAATRTFRTLRDRRGLLPLVAAGDRVIVEEDVDDRTLILSIALGAADASNDTTLAELRASPGDSAIRFTRAVLEGRTLVLGGWRNDARGATGGALVGLELSRGSTAARVLYDRRDDLAYGILRLVAAPEPGRLHLIKTVSAPGRATFFDLDERDLATGALVAQWAGGAQFLNQPTLLADARRGRTIVIADSKVSSCAAGLVCTEAGQAWSLAYADAALSTDGGVFASTPEIENGVVLHHAIDLSRVPGGAAAPPDRVTPSGGAVVFEPDGEHLLVLHGQGGTIDRYRLRR